jgi:hypothetical protein
MERISDPLIAKNGLAEDFPRVWNLKKAPPFSGQETQGHLYLFAVVARACERGHLAAARSRNGVNRGTLSRVTSVEPYLKPHGWASKCEQTQHSIDLKKRK